MLSKRLVQTHMGSSSPGSRFALRTNPQGESMSSKAQSTAEQHPEHANGARVGV
jgi:hypothetical protein